MSITKTVLDPKYCSGNQGNNLKSKFAIYSFFIAIVSLMVGFRPGGGGVTVVLYYVGMCRCEGYGFQAVYVGIGNMNQRVWV